MTYKWSTACQFLCHELRPGCFVGTGALLHTTSYSFLQHLHRMRWARVKMSSREVFLAAAPLMYKVGIYLANAQC